MTRTIRCVATVVALLCATAASAAKFGTTERFVREFRLNTNGTLSIDNPFGNVEIVGGNVANVTIRAQKTVTGIDDAAIREALDQTQLTTTGSPESLIIRTLLPAIRTERWMSVVHYAVSVPSTVHVKISSQMSDRLRVANVSGGANIKNVNGAIVIENVTGPVVADTVNGDITYDPSGSPTNGVQLSSVNGRIEVAVTPEASFQWIGRTIRGDFRTNLPVSGRMSGTTFRGGINGARGATITTATMMGDVFVLKKGTKAEQTQSVRSIVGTAAAGGVGPAILVKSFHATLVDGDFTFNTPLGNVSVGQVRGRARVTTRAGEVGLGLVLGECTVTSFGGPLSFGDIVGFLNARTSAGDVVINSARAGGFAATDGGMIRVLHAGAAMTLRSGGGDILVANANGSINAETRSGDVTITVAPQVRRSPIYAKTSQGNVVLTVSPQFAADIDATLITVDEDAEIRSDFAGLSVRRDQVGQKTRIHATGKVNGGGDRVELFAEDGTIQITGESRPVVISPSLP
jgi:DUF4097 and DUF4098 domain-containing protein YvlB